MRATDFIIETQRMSAAAKLQRAWEREQQKSAASAKRGREYMDQIKKDVDDKDKKKEQGVAEGLTDDPRFQRAMKKIANTTPRAVVQYPADLIPPNASPDERERLLSPIRRPSVNVFQGMLNDFLDMRRNGVDTEEALDRIRSDLEESDYEWTDNEIASILGDLNANDIPDVDYDEKGVAEIGNNYHANTTGFSKTKRDDDERHDLDTPRPTIYGLKINGQIWKKDGHVVTFATREKALAARNSLLTRRPELEVGLIQSGGTMESATSGATGSGSIASVAMPLGGKKKKKGTGVNLLGGPVFKR